MIECEGGGRSNSLVPFFDSDGTIDSGLFPVFPGTSNSGSQLRE
jgi:hypothetical protein